MTDINIIPKHGMPSYSISKSQIKILTGVVQGTFWWDYSLDWHWFRNQYFASTQLTNHKLLIDGHSICIYRYLNHLIPAFIRSLKYIQKCSVFLMWYIYRNRMKCKWKVLGGGMGRKTDVLIIMLIFLSLGYSLWQNIYFNEKTDQKLFLCIQQFIRSIILWSECRESAQWLFISQSRLIFNIRTFSLKGLQTITLIIYFKNLCFSASVFLLQMWEGVDLIFQFNIIPYVFP